MKEGGPESIQSEVWASVSQIAACHDVRSASEDLGDIFEKAKLDESERVDVSAVDAYLENMTAHGYIIEGTRSPLSKFSVNLSFLVVMRKKPSEAGYRILQARIMGNVQLIPQIVSPDFSPVSGRLMRHLGLRTLGTS